MDVLFIVKEFPHSRVIGGPIIIYNRVKYLAENHTVSVLAFGDEPTPEQRASVSRYCLDLQLVPFVPARHGVLQRVRDLVFAPVPPYFMNCYSKEMYGALGGMVRRHHYDVVVSEYSMVAQYLYHNPDLAGVKRVMSVHECYYLARKKVFQMEGFSREGLLALYNLEGLRGFEFDMYADADRVLTLTQEGRGELLRIRPGLDVSVVPHGVDVEHFKPGDRGEGPPTVMFLGNYPHDPNRDAVIFYGTQAWPEVRKRVPGARFLVVGRGPTEDMRELAARDDSIEITGQVDDVLPYLAMSDVFVCPVRLGGGFRGKVLEAMAAGVPVVSTGLGAEGLPAKDGENILLAETPDQLADATVRMLTDRERARRISARARELVERDYSWRRGVEILERVLVEVVGDASR